jgi:hypothetical protein
MQKQPHPTWKSVLLFFNPYNLWCLHFLVIANQGVEEVSWLHEGSSTKKQIGFITSSSPTDLIVIVSNIVVRIL